MQAYYCVVFKRCFSQIEREAYVILGEALGGSTGAGDVIQLRQLASVVEGIVVVEAVEERRHPPGEALDLPDAAQAGLRISVKEVAATGGIEIGEGTGKNADVGDG